MITNPNQKISWVTKYDDINYEILSDDTEMAGDVEMGEPRDSYSDGSDIYTDLIEFSKYQEEP